MPWVNAEALELRAMAKDFAQGEIRPYLEGWDAERRLPDEIFGKLAEMGFLGMSVPEDHGGLGLDLTTQLLVLEALAWGDAAVALSVAIHGGPVVRALLDHGSEAQQAMWLPKLASGEALGAFALSETDAGSDATALELEARRGPEGWTLSGRKRWVTNGDRAGLLLLFARTGEGSDGISAFLVPRDTPGIEGMGRERTLGLSASETAALDFDDVHLDDEALLGPEGQGWEIARGSLVVGRMSVAAQALGIAQAAYEHAIRYSREREQFGRALSDFGATREKLARMAQRIEESRALLLMTAGRWKVAAEEGTVLGRAGEDPLHLPASLEAAAAMAKVSASESAMWIADEAVQIFGGYGYMRDYPVEKLMRDAKGAEIYEGTNEVLRWLVARDLLHETEGS
jgi:acyl-CoA dehydrogenase